jgi:hypothetical protein
MDWEALREVRNVASETGVFVGYLTTTVPRFGSYSRPRGSLEFSEQNQDQHDN